MTRLETAAAHEAAASEIRTALAGLVTCGRALARSPLASVAARVEGVARLVTELQQAEEDERASAARLRRVRWGIPKTNRGAS